MMSMYFLSASSRLNKGHQSSSWVLRDQVVGEQPVRGADCVVASPSCGQAHNAISLVLLVTPKGRVEALV
jgi:hypothetical protein